MGHFAPIIPESGATARWGGHSGQDLKVGEVVGVVLLLNPSQSR